MTAEPEVVFVLPDKLGGVYNYVDNMVRHVGPDRFSYAAVLTDNVRDGDTRSSDPLSAERVEKVRYSLPPENIYAVLKRVAAAIGRRPGVLVANDWIELATAAVHDTGRAVVAVAHGDFGYYYDLALKHEATIDAFVTYTTRIADRLREVLPHRADAVFQIPYGVAIPREVRTPQAGELRALYVGRLNRSKGVFDLPAIDDELRRRGCNVAWTVQGAGPDEEELRRVWSGDRRITWMGRQPMAKVLALYPRHDVLVMPSRNEGLPVALLEAGAAGVVPVVSNLASGVPEVVEPGVNGFRPEPGDIGGFAEAVTWLADRRDRLEDMSAAIRGRVSQRFDAVRCTAEYQRLFERVFAARRPYTRRPLPYGSRLDRPWIPNGLVQWIRARA